MKVYVVFHADIEGDKSVRGVFASRESAEALCLERVDRTTYGPKTLKYHLIDRAGSACCEVQEWDVKA